MREKHILVSWQMSPICANVCGGGGVFQGIPVCPSIYFRRNLKID
jgi:hypothetical protein